VKHPGGELSNRRNVHKLDGWGGKGDVEGLA